MAKLPYGDKVVLEKFLKMEQGYLLNFSTSSLEKFVYDVAKIGLFDPKYPSDGSSKAKRMRAIWDTESNFVVGKVLTALLEFYRERRPYSQEYFDATPDLEQQYEKISTRLLSEGVSPHVEAIQASVDDVDFTKLAEAIRKSIENNEPELALDRLHTFYVKYMRSLCTAHGIDFKIEESLNAVFGKYSKYIESLGILESQMSLAIVKYSINLIEKYNDVRNNRSLAHDNKLLNYHESLFIFDTLARLKSFLDYLEKQVEQKRKVDRASAEIFDDLPY